jgi:hypothetical protein
MQRGVVMDERMKKIRELLEDIENDIGSGDNKEKCTQLKKKSLHEPVAPYFATSYITLVSVVQGLALGALVYLFYDKGRYDLRTILESSISFGLICIIWHRYVIHTQYIAWRLSFFDTLIPISFAITQYWLSISIYTELNCFSIAFTANCIVGLAAYLNAGRQFQHNGAEMREILKEHFIDNEVADEFYRILYLFEMISIHSFVYVVLTSVFVTDFNYFNTSFSENNKTIITTSIFGALLVSMIFYDLRYQLNKSVKLKDYGYKG